MSSIDPILKDKLIELADQEFPKGDKGRGQAMVLVALSLQAIEAYIAEREKQAIIQGRIKELVTVSSMFGISGRWKEKIEKRKAHLTNQLKSNESSNE